MSIHPDFLRNPVDRLSTVLEQFRVRAQLIHAGPLCGVTHHAAEPGLGFLHVVRRGGTVAVHGPADGVPPRLEITEPSVLFYPRALAHDFHNTPERPADFTCARLAFDGGADHPLARALPPLVVLPIARVQGIEHTLSLLYAETERVRCGQRLLADRLFEVLLMQLLRWLLDHRSEAGLPVGLLTGLGHPALARALVAMHDRPGEPWSIEAMAQCAGMSRSVFASSFKTHVGETPAEYLTHWRVALAQGRLRRGVAVKHLAGDLGYASAAAFSRVFTQRVGLSPRAWLQAEEGVAASTSAALDG